MKNNPITKQAFLKMIESLPDNAQISFKAYHYEPSGRRSNIGDNLEITITDNRICIEISEEKPETLNYE